MKGRKAFTLIELLIVIAIIAILGSATVLVLNPIELTAQARDSQRINDLGVIKKAVDLAIFNNSSVLTGTAQRVYLSLPSATAPSCDAVGLPNLPVGWQYICSSQTNLTKTDGSGWLPINFSSTGNPAMTSLPIDPVNTVASGKYYTYVTGGSYELTAVMESGKENKAAVLDGGSLTGVLQVGTHIDLTPPMRDRGLVGYWTFDEGLGTTVYDLSGYGNNGTLYNSPTWQTGTSCKSGSCLKFNIANNNYIVVPDSTSTDAITSLTLQAWVYPVSSGGTNSKSTIINGSSSYYLSLDDTNSLSCYWYGTSPAGYHTTAAESVPLNKWTHIACVWNGSVLKQYIDGELVQTISVVGTGRVASTVLIGAESFDRQLDGFMDGVRIYNRALSADEMKVVYNSQK